MRLIFTLFMCFLLSGCVASIVKDVVTAPVKIISKSADILTTSQSEADEKRGRQLRKNEEEQGKLSRRKDKASEKCKRGDADSCRNAAELEEEIDRLK
jgi:hypothetical protein